MQKNIFILLGSNLGDRKTLLQRARRAIDNNCGKIVGMSQLYETAPWGFESEHWFINQVIQLETDLSPEHLLEKLLAMEALLGRIRTETQYSSRNIDIDLLYYNTQIIDNETLNIPHPRLHLRRFTLLPLTEIAPHFIHPLLQKSQLELLNELVDNSVVRRLGYAAN
ncbi:MAG: 2-amino-4-hydroxy-6-hydroxymethyldihydropteridine diphosphokinase [Bacteroidetes bacterium]|nr:2-amino-4-hydroxy-6-hydroxymethyldihydropteridine diphosphokinase [Bacteroidota bacterium]